MADTKLADLTALTTPSGDDILYVVDDPAGTPLDRKIALDNLFTRGTITTSLPVIDASQTWNASGVTFTGLKFNAATGSSAGSAAASLLMDLQLEGVSQAYILKGGTSFFGAIRTAPLYCYSDTVSARNDTTANRNLAFTGVSLQLRTGGHFGFTSGDAAGTADTILTRRAAANLRLGAADAAAPVAQTLSVQSVVAGTTNIAGTNLTITGSQGTGTGAGGSIIFQVAPAGSSGSAQNALATALTISNNKNATFTGSVTVSGAPVIAGTYLQALENNTFLYAGASADLALARDAANTLALRNGTNAQTFNIYNTYTSGTSYERYSVDWITTANLVIVGPNKGSAGGTQRVQRLSYLEDGGAGSTVPLLGSTCPAASGTVKSWIKVITSDGTTAYVPCWA